MHAEKSRWTRNLILLSDSQIHPNHWICIFYCDRYLLVSSATMNDTKAAPKPCNLYPFRKAGAKRVTLMWDATPMISTPIWLKKKRNNDSSFLRLSSGLKIKCVTLFFSSNSLKFNFPNCVAQESEVAGAIEHFPRLCQDSSRHLSADFLKLGNESVVNFLKKCMTGRVGSYT